MYSMKFIEIGDMVPELLNANMLVLFGPTAPNELKDMCAVHDGAPTKEKVLRVGGTISFGKDEYKIIAMGEAANENFGGLGHVTVIFGKRGEVLPGNVVVAPDTPPSIFTGEIISIN